MGQPGEISTRCRIPRSRSFPTKLRSETAVGGHRNEDILIPTTHFSLHALGLGFYTPDFSKLVHRHFEFICFRHLTLLRSKALCASTTHPLHLSSLRHSLVQTQDGGPSRPQQRPPFLLRLQHRRMPGTLARALLLATLHFLSLLKSINNNTDPSRRSFIFKICKQRAALVWGLGGVVHVGVNFDDAGLPC